MKILFVCIVLCLATNTLFAVDNSQVIMDARGAAQTDGEAYSGFGWGLSSYAASLLLTPLFGGLGVTLVAYIAGEATIPDSRLLAAQEAYGDPDQVMLFRQTYVEALTQTERDKDGGAALLGAGLGLATYAVLALVVVDLFSGGLSLC